MATSRPPAENRTDGDMLSRTLGLGDDSQPSGDSPTVAPARSRLSVGERSEQEKDKLLPTSMVHAPRQRFAKGGDHGLVAHDGTPASLTSVGDDAPATSSSMVCTRKRLTSCELCTQRKKRCDYIELNGERQTCTLCRERKVVCLFGLKPSRRNKALSKPQPPKIKRARMGASMATGLVGYEENIFINDFFDLLSFFPLANQSTIQRALLSLFFQEPEDSSRGTVKRRHSHALPSSISVGQRRFSTGSSNPSSGSASIIVRGAHEEEGDQGETSHGSLTISRKYSGNDESTAFSCVLWCTVALGAMTRNMPTHMVHSYVRNAENAADELTRPTTPASASAYAIMAMVHAWLDDADKFKRSLDMASNAVAELEENGIEVPMPLQDMMTEQKRVYALHYSDDEAVTKECVYADIGEPPELMSALMSDTGLFHLVQYYSDRVIKAFWRDVLEYDHTLTQTKLFAEQHEKTCNEIEKIAKTREGLKNTGGALYIRAAMQFMRLPLKRDVMETLQSYIDMVEIICKIPGMIRYGPLKHYVHCLVLGLSRPSLENLDRGAYEKLREEYNKLHIPGPDIPCAADLEIADLCQHPFCNSMAWVKQKMAAEMRMTAQQAKRNACSVSLPTPTVHTPPAPVSPSAVGPGSSAAQSQRRHSSGQPPVSGDLQDPSGGDGVHVSGPLPPTAGNDRTVASQPLVDSAGRSLYLNEPTGPDFASAPGSSVPPVRGPRPGQVDASFPQAQSTAFVENMTMAPAFDAQLPSHGSTESNLQNVHHGASAALHPGANSAGHLLYLDSAASWAGHASMAGVDASITPSGSWSPQPQHRHQHQEPGVSYTQGGSGGLAPALSSPWTMIPTRERMHSQQGARSAEWHGGSSSGTSHVSMNAGYTPGQQYLQEAEPVVSEPVHKHGLAQVYNNTSDEQSLGRLLGVIDEPDVPELYDGESDPEDYDPLTAVSQSMSNTSQDEVASRDANTNMITDFLS